MFSVLSGLVFLVGVILQIRMTVVRYKAGRPSSSTLAWNAMYGLALIVMSALGLAGLLDGDAVSLASSAFAATLLVSLSWLTVGGWRDGFLGSLSSAGAEPKARRRWEAGLLLLFGILSLLTAELPWSHVIPIGGPSFWWLDRKSVV